MTISPDAARTSARRVTTTALLAALLAAASAVALPFGAVPVTLQVFVVVLIALVVPPRWAALAVGTYLLVGVAGMPVFSGMRGGPGVLTGPTGGYLIGFLVGSSAGAWVRVRLARTVGSVTVVDAVAGAVTIAIVYSLGWLQLTLVTGMDPIAALVTGVLPFIVPDGLKTVAAVTLAPIVRRAAAD